jgi:hypothetical protein
MDFDELAYWLRAVDEYNCATAGATVGGNE